MEYVLYLPPGPSDKRVHYQELLSRQRKHLSSRLSKGSSRRKVDLAIYDIVPEEIKTGVPFASDTPGMFRVDPGKNDEIEDHGPVWSRIKVENMAWTHRRNCPLYVVVQPSP